MRGYWESTTVKPTAESVTSGFLEKDTEHYEFVDGKIRYLFSNVEIFINWLGRIEEAKIPHNNKFYGNLNTLMENNPKLYAWVINILGKERPEVIHAGELEYSPPSTQVKTETLGEYTTAEEAGIVSL